LRRSANEDVEHEPDGDGQVPVVTPPAKTASRGSAMVIST
jgi:hypothetical protein